MVLRHGTFNSSLGELLIASEGDALVGLYFADHKHPPKPEDLGEDLGFEPHDETLQQVALQLREYLRGERRSFEFQIAPRGDDFSQAVWSLLSTIPYGESTTYGALAQQLGNRSLAQRVGQAVGHNPIMVVIPCHRVLGADGSLTGYAGGLDRKRELLQLEEPPAAVTDRLF